MNHIKHFVLAVLMLLTVQTWAYDFEVDGICYNITNETGPYEVEVTINESNAYFGIVVIPSFVSCEGVDYSVTGIGESAFKGCIGLTSIEIPNSVTNIGWLAFSGCTGLTSIEIPSSVVSIPYNSFVDCSGLEQIIVEPENLKYFSFENCNAIFAYLDYDTSLVLGCKNTVIPDFVKRIGTSAFSGCTGLTSIEIPNSVTYIEKRAFSGCTGLTSIFVSSETPPILGGDYVFQEVNKAIPIYVPCGSEAAYALIQWGGFSDYFGTCPGEISVSASPVEGGMVSGTGFYEGGATCTLTATANEGFFFGSWKKEGTIVSRDSIYSFYVSGDTSLEAYFAIKAECIQFADANVKARCVSLWDADGDGELSYDEARAVTSIEYSFDGNSLITTFDELQYFTGLTSIGHEAFSKCRTLTSIIIPGSVTSIGSSAFSYCDGLTSMTIPYSVDSIVGNPFSGCKNLTSIVVEEGNRRYDSRNNCNAIIETATNTLIAGCNTTVIPNSVVKIGSSAFYGSGLSSIDIPISVLSIGESAFGNCKSLASITIGESVKEMDLILRYCKNLNQLVYNAIDCISVGSSLGPFFGSATKTIIIGKDVRSLPRNFWGIKVEDHIVVRASVPPQNYGYKTLSSFDTPICVPPRSLSAYQNDVFWGQFTNYSTSYLIDVRSSDETIGSVRIVEQPDCFSENNIATILAEPIGDHPFINWTSNGQVISTANPYTFVVEDDVELVANFYGTGIDEESEQMVSISPNPAQNTINIECESMKRITLCALDGRVLSAYQLNANNTTLDLASLSKGVYIFRVETRNGISINKKIIKE